MPHIGFRTNANLSRLLREDCSLVVLELTLMVVEWRQCLVKVTSSWYENISQHSQGVQVEYFNLNSKWWAIKRIHYLHENGIVKSISRHCIIASLQKPPAAKLWSLGWVLLPYPHTPYILYNLFHVILPRLSREDCSLVVLDLKHMVVKWRHCLVKVTSSCDIAPLRIWGIWLIIK